MRREPADRREPYPTEATSITAASAGSFFEGVDVMKIAQRMQLPVGHVVRSVKVEEFTPDEITEKHGRTAWNRAMGHGAGAAQLTGQTWCWRGPETDWRHIFLRATSTDD